MHLRLHAGSDPLKSSQSELVEGRSNGSPRASLSTATASNYQAGIQTPRRIRAAGIACRALIRPRSFGTESFSGLRKRSSRRSHPRLALLPNPTAMPHAPFHGTAADRVVQAGSAGDGSSTAAAGGAAPQPRPQIRRKLGMHDQPTSLDSPTPAGEWPKPTEVFVLWCMARQLGMFYTHGLSRDPSGVQSLPRIKSTPIVRLQALGGRRHCRSCPIPIQGSRRSVSAG